MQSEAEKALAGIIGTDHASTVRMIVYGGVFLGMSPGDTTNKVREFFVLAGLSQSFYTWREVYAMAGEAAESRAIMLADR